VQVTIVGAGIAGLCCALELSERGVDVQLLERAATLGAGSCSWCAGGMLAPWCELEAGAEPLIAELGQSSLQWWRSHLPALRCSGTVVVAARRDMSELARFAGRTQHYRWLSGHELGLLEPELGGRFEQALYFPEEAHLDPRQAMPHLAACLQRRGAQLRLGNAAAAGSVRGDYVLDCRGLAARDRLSDLRGVKGEMLLVQSRELRLQRPVRLLHPRIPVYVVPRGEGIYMIGATSIESDDASGVSVRSALELLSAAYTLHPAFGEARILECAAQVRPAFADHRPHIRREGHLYYVNGLYRHGFLLAPGLARALAAHLLEGEPYPEIIDEDRPQRRLA
jgi:glycine oxidase